MSIKNFIYSRKDEGIYRKRTILGIKITTKLNKPKELQNTIPIFEVIKYPNYSTEKKYKLAIILAFGIGDYILFRKFLPYVRDYYKSYNITLIGNNSHKDIIEYFDVNYIDEYICYQGIFCNIEELKSFLDKNNMKYDILISHFYGRQPPHNDMVSVINAREKIGSYGSLGPLSHGMRGNSSKIYTKLIYNNIDEDETTHEITRNKNFFEQLLDVNIKLNDMNIEIDKKFFEKIDFNFNKKFFILFPSSAEDRKMYNNEYFAKICNYLCSRYNLICYIVGSKSDGDLANEIIQISNSKNIKNICGRYKLNELFYIFNKAKLIITVDSAGYHMGVSVSDNIIVITSGMSYGRYLKYPKELVNGKNINIVLPKELEEDIENNNTKLDYEYEPLYDLQSIKPDYICKLIDDKYKF